MKILSRFLLIFFFSGLALTTVRADALTAAFERVKSSVVSIAAQEKNVAVSSTAVAALPNVGVGVLIARHGDVMTSDDLVQTADWIEVMFSSGEVVSARVQTSASQADVALLDLEKIPKSAQGVLFGDSDKVTIGQPVFVVLVSSASEPRMIACHIKGRWKPETVMEDFLQGDLLEIDSKLSRQDAGAPVFNANGEVIGIVSNVLSTAGGFSGMGFAIPSNLAVKLTLNEPFFWSGLSGRLLSGAMAQSFHLPQERGFLIEKISSTSPSAKLGLRAGTKVTEMDGKPIIVGGDVVLEVDGLSFAADDAMNQIRRHLKNVVKGATLRVKVFRDGKVEELISTFDR